MKTQALQYVRPDRVAVVCAWCADKEQADADATLAGYEITHTICPKCAAEQRERDRAWKWMWKNDMHPFGGSI